MRWLRYGGCAIILLTVLGVTRLTMPVNGQTTPGNNQMLYLPFVSGPHLTVENIAIHSRWMNQRLALYETLGKVVNPFPHSVYDVQVQMYYSVPEDPAVPPLLLTDPAYQVPLRKIEPGQSAAFRILWSLNPQQSSLSGRVQFTATFALSSTHTYTGVTVLTKEFVHSSEAVIIYGKVQNTQAVAVDQLTIAAAVSATDGTLLGANSFYTDTVIPPGGELPYTISLSKFFFQNFDHITPSDIQLQAEARVKIAK